MSQLQRVTYKQLKLLLFTKRSCPSVLLPFTDQILAFAVTIKVDKKRIQRAINDAVLIMATYRPYWYFHFIVPVQHCRPVRHLCKCFIKPTVCMGWVLGAYWVGHRTGRKNRHELCSKGRSSYERRALEGLRFPLQAN